LRGVIVWNIYTDYDHRFTEAYRHLHDLNREIDRLKKQYTAFVRTRQAATQSYEGYDNDISRLRSRIFAAREKVDALMSSQGHMLEVMAVTELAKRRDRLEKYQVDVRFAMADSYDRARKAEQRKKVEP
jgi:predicted  nucleic acid-binding Zn-ribbon protein